MKRFFIHSILSLIISIIPIHAKNTIDAQIEAIQKAPISERFKLMNAFKKNIITMKEEERIHALMELKSITKSKYGHKVLDDIRLHKRIAHRNKENEIKEHIQSTAENIVEDEIKNEGNINE